MNSRDKRWLTVGIVIGLFIGGAAATGVYMRSLRRQISPAAMSASQTSETAPTIEDTSGEVKGAVQLSSDEQAKIGIQTTEVRRESFTQDVTAIGRVEEPTDLNAVWVRADVFDADLAHLRPGSSGTITSEAIPGLRLNGKVDFIDTRSDPQTRTTSVRVQVDNPGTRLRPGMIVQAVFHISFGMLLTVPRQAVLDSGTEKTVYIARDNGVFEQRRIQTGVPSKDRYPVTEGLKTGDRVVTNGVFLVDSQTRLTGGMTGMFGGSKSFTGPAASATPVGKTFKMTFRIDPDPPLGGRENRIHVALTDPDGKLVTDAQVRLTFVMPAMPAMNMPEMRSSVELKWTGSEYAGPIQIMMAGGWNVAIEARRGNERLTTMQAHINAR